MIVRFIALFILFSFPVCSNQKIVETYAINSIQPYINSDTWVLIDLDNTLFESKQALGHANWFYDLIQEKMQKGASKEQSIKEIYPLWIQTQKICDVKPVESRMVELIKEYQAMGVVVMGLTHRQVSVIKSTLRQVGSLDLDFRLTAPYKEKWKWEDKCPTVYTKGILFVGDFNSKASVFLEFLKTVEKKPRHIVLIDDNRTHVEELGKALEKENIDYVGVHYRAIEKSEKVYYPEIAVFQLRFCEHIISNEAAFLLIEEGIEN